LSCKLSHFTTVAFDIILNIYKIIDSTINDGYDSLNGILMQKGYVNVILKDSSNNVYGINQCCSYNQKVEYMIVVHRFDFPEMK
jgi:hypothetical protein